MKCNCCDNRIWIEPIWISKRIQIMVEKGKSGIQTGIEMTIEQAEEFSQDLIREINQAKSTEEL